MKLTSKEQNTLHDMLRQHGKMTQDDCWDAIEVFEKFLEQKELNSLSCSNFEHSNQVNLPKSE